MFAGVLEYIFCTTFRGYVGTDVTVEEVKFSIKDFFCKCDQIRWKYFVQCMCDESSQLIAISK